MSFHETDLVERLHAVAEGFAMPAAPLADDLNRGRRRVRRNRGLLAGGVALGVASVLAAVSLVTGGGPAEPPQPVDQPTTTSTPDPKPENPGLNAPLVAPESILQVRELGFHVEGFRALGGQLKPDRQSIEVVVSNSSGHSTFAVEVYYQGKAPGLLASDQPRQKVSIHGIAGTFVARFEDGGYATYLIWEYAPDSWARVWRFDDIEMPSRKAEILSIAEAIRPGGVAVRLPFRIGSASAPMLQAETVVDVHLSQDTEYWSASFESGLGIMGLPAGSACDRPPTSSRFIEAFTYRGYAGCLEGTGNDKSQVDAVILQVDGADRRIHNSGSSLTGYEIEDLKQLLAEITVAPSENTATWFDLTTALGG